MAHDPFRWPPALPRRPIRGRWWFVAALVALLAGWLRLGSVTETTPIDVVMVVPDEKAARAATHRLAETLEGQPGVRSVTVEPAGEEPCEELLSRFISEPLSRPAAVVLVNPVGGDDPVAAARLGAAARRAGVSVGAIVERPESAPGVSILLPSRWAAVAGGPGRPRGNGAAVMIAISGLRRLATPIEIVLRGPKPDTWDANALNQQLAGEVRDVMRGADGSATIQLDPDKTPADALLYLRTRGDTVAPGRPWVEAELRSEGKTVAVDRWAPDTRPPKILLVPSIAMCTKAASAVPATPQDALRLGSHRGPPWSLLHGIVYPGLVTVWPASLDRNLDGLLGSGRAAELKDTGALRRTFPAAAELKEFEAVVIDASLPVGLTRERGNSDERLLAGGLLAAGGQYTSEEINRFQSDLRDYVEGGGTLLLIGANIFAWERADGTLRSLLERVAPHLAGFTPAPLRSRWVIGIDNSESMMSAERASLGSLPPLLAEKRVALLYDPHTAAQYERMTGRPAARKDDRVMQPTRQELAQHFLSRLFGGGGADANDIEAQSLASSRLVDTPAELSHAAVDHLLATLGHPELLPEINGRPAFRRHEPRDKATADEQPFWVVSHPFAGGEPRDLFGTHFSYPDKAVSIRPSLASPRATCVEWASFRDYLARQVFVGDYSRTLTWGFFDATDTGQEGSETVWRVVDSGGKAAPLREEKKASLTLPSGRQRFYFFAVPKIAPLPSDAPLGTLLDLSPNRLITDPPPLKRLLRHGRGRWLSLLEYQAARDLAALRCEVPAEGVKMLREAGATAEAIDIIRRVVQDELRPAFATPYRPTTGWTSLATSTAGDPIAAHSALGRGHVVLALVEPPHDRAIDERLRDPGRNWVDFSALLLPPTDTHPGQLLDTGFKLARVGDQFHLTAHSVRREAGRDFWPPITTAPEITASVTVTLRLFDDWSAVGPVGSEIKENIELTPSQPWIVPLKKLKSVPSPPAHAGPRLLEIEITWKGLRTSVFAPIPYGLIDVPPGEDLGEVSPANRLIDLLLEVFARKPVWRVERLPGRRTLRLWSPKVAARPRNLKIYAADIELAPANWTLDDSIPGQWIVRMKPGAAWAGSELRVNLQGDDGEESHFVDGFASDQQERPLRLALSLDAGPRPTPWTGVLDALAISTAPPTPPGEDDIAAHHGVMDTTFDGSEVSASKLEDFMVRYVRLRSESRTTRYWYLVALALAVIGIACRRRSLKGGWTSREGDIS